jgi:glycosyltransferase involved in cell wall biosynthesis
MRQRILFVSNLFPPAVIGGAEIVAHRHAVALAARGHDLAVFAGFLSDSDHLEGAISLDEKDGFPIYRLPVSPFSPDQNFYWPEAASRLRSIVTAHRPDIIHFHNLTGLGANLILVAKALGVRTVVTLHDHWGFCYKNTILRPNGAICTNFEECAGCLPRIRISDRQEVPIRLRRDYVLWCLSNADRLLSPSAYMESAYKKALSAGRPISKLSYGVDLGAIPATERPVEGCMEFVCFSYLAEHKGIPTLLAAAEELARQQNLRGRWRLTIAGGGHLAKSLVRDIALDRFQGAVRYLGRLSNVEALQLLEQSHVVVLASIWPENEPVTLLEAIASGAAQLATRIGGNTELVKENLSGLLVSPGDIEQLANAMKLCILEPARVARYQAYNRGRRDRFDQMRTIEKLESLYENTPIADPVSDFVVICAGGPASREAEMMVNHFHIVEAGAVRTRFVWHEWADAVTWNAAKIVWFWRDAGEGELPLIWRAQRRGVPVLLPRDGRSLPLVGHAGQTFSYINFLHALGTIAALSEVPNLSQILGIQGKRVNRLIEAISPLSTFNFPLELPL